MIEPGTRRQDCGQITDGAVAVVLASERFMQRYAARRGVKVNEFPQILGWGHTNAGIRFLDKLERSKGEEYMFPHVRKAITDAWRRAGIDGVDSARRHRDARLLHVHRVHGDRPFRPDPAGPELAGDRQRLGRDRRQRARSTRRAA